jgi:hypothetical protein
VSVRSSSLLLVPSVEAGVIPNPGVSVRLFGEVPMLGPGGCSLALSFDEGGSETQAGGPRAGWVESRD